MICIQCNSNEYSLSLKMPCKECVNEGSCLNGILSNLDGPLKK